MKILHAKLTGKLNTLQESVENISMNYVDKIVDDFKTILLDSARQVKIIKRKRSTHVIKKPKEKSIKTGITMSTD